MNRAGRRATNRYKVEVSDIGFALVAAADAVHGLESSDEEVGVAWVDSATSNKGLHRAAILLNLGDPSQYTNRRRFTMSMDGHGLPSTIRYSRRAVLNEAWATAFASSLVRAGYKVQAAARRHP